MVVSFGVIAIGVVKGGDKYELVLDGVYYRRAFDGVVDFGFGYDHVGVQ